MGYDFRLAKNNEIDTIYSLYEKRIQWMDHTGIQQWNQFLKDFCLDKHSDYYSNKLKVASILWKEVRVSKNEKKYSRKLLTEYADKIEGYYK